MKWTLLVFVAAALALTGCKHSGWVWNSPEPLMVEDDHSEDPEDAKHVIFVLGVDGMD
jgi:hypothetical protein